MKTEKTISTFARALFARNPVFSLGLGLCAGIAVEPDPRQALVTGIFTSITLFLTAVVASAMKKVLPRQVRIPCMVLMIAGSLTLIRFMLQAYFPVFESRVAGYYPLLACSCLVLGHTESFAFIHSVRTSAADAAGVGIGYTLALVVMAVLREMLGCGTFLGKRVLIGNLIPMNIFAMAPGALFLAGCICAFVKWVVERRKGAEK